MEDRPYEEMRDLYVERLPGSERTPDRLNPRWAAIPFLRIVKAAAFAFSSKQGYLFEKWNIASQNSQNVRIKKA
jgi:hypothetical protein